jgi:hypothetical protein
VLKREEHTKGFVYGTVIIFWYVLSLVLSYEQIKSKLDGGLDADKHIQKEVGESPRVWQKPLLYLGPVHPRARTIVWNGGCARVRLGNRVGYLVPVV